MQIKPALLILACAAWPAAAQQQEQNQPLSAIDWLAVQRNAPPVVLIPDQNPIAESATIPNVEVQPLDAPEIGGVGLLPSSVTGLPPTLWQGSTEAAFASSLERMETRRPTVPALNSLLHLSLIHI